MIRVVQRAPERARSPRCGRAASRTNSASSGRLTGRPGAEPPERGEPADMERDRSADNGRARLHGRPRPAAAGVALRTARSSTSRCSVTKARIAIAGQIMLASSSIPAQVKPGPKAVSMRPLGQAAADQPVEHEQHGRRAHIAIVAQHVALEVERPAGSSSAVSIASITLTPPGWQQKRSMSLRGRSHVRQHAVDRPRQLGFDERRDGAVEHHRQARILDPPAHDVRACRATFARPSRRCVASPARPPATTAAAAPSPNMAVATIAAGSSLSRRMEIEQVSTVTNSQRLPGSAAARRAAVARPLTPPAQPSPNIGTRRTSARRPMRGPIAGVEAGRGDAGGRDGDHAVDVAMASGPPARSPPSRPPRTARRMHPDRRRLRSVQP